MLTVNGAALPAPSAMKVSLFNVVTQAARTASGCAVVDRIGVKRKLELKWTHLNAAGMQSLLAATGSDTFFSAVYPDPATGAARTMQCYCEERKAGVLRMDGGSPVWTNIELTLVER